MRPTRLDHRRRHGAQCRRRAAHTRGRRSPCRCAEPSSQTTKTMASLTPIDIFSVGNILGEGILWDSRREVLWWTDIQARQLHRYEWTHGTMQILDTPERVG